MFCLGKCFAYSALICAIMEVSVAVPYLIAPRLFHHNLVLSNDVYAWLKTFCRFCSFHQGLDYAPVKSVDVDFAVW